MKPLAQNTMIQNRYLIVHLIGKGGMGEVYLAVDQRLGSAVALKRTFFAGDEMLGNAFEREARILARMRHPVLPKVSDHFGEGEEQFLVMEHISGDDLAKRLETSQKPFPASWVLFWADQLLDALSYLHSHEPPIIHRDIKPQNLKLTDENHIILLDFGLSKSSTPGQTLLSETGSSTGSVVGYTPHYAPMEQIRGIGTSPKSDLYSLSATLYQLMTNKVPADALSRADCLLNGMSDPIEPLHVLNPEISQSVSDVILKGMEVSQEKRYSNAREMQKILRKAFTDMQKATSADTVAFNIGAAGIEAPPAVGFIGTSQPEAGTPSAALSNGGSNADVFDATIALNPTSQPPVVKQADLKTEVFLAGSNSFEIPNHDAPLPFEPPANEEKPLQTDKFSETNDFSQMDFDPAPAAANDGATVPYIAIQGSDATYDAAPVNIYGDPEVLGEAGEISTHFPGTDATQSIPAKPAVAKKKSAGKFIGLLAGLAALFLLAAAAAGGGWYYYTNVYLPGLVAEESPTPIPSSSPTPEITPSPEPTLESLDNSNSNGNSVFGGNSNTSGNTATTVDPTPERTENPEVSRTPNTERTPISRQTPRPPKTTPTVKPQPKKQPTPLQ
ncbi:MAG: serine/threonine-protein kinase [Pyrinomonadaceae bacterium]